MGITVVMTMRSYVSRVLESFGARAHGVPLIVYWSHGFRDLLRLVGVRFLESLRKSYTKTDSFLHTNGLERN